MDQSMTSQNRRSRRSPVLLTASVEVDGTPMPVKLRNLSEDGALIEGDCLPPEGSITFFERDNLRLKSEVVWVEDRLAGVASAPPRKRWEVLRALPQPRRGPRPESRPRGPPGRPLPADDPLMTQRLLLPPPPLAE